MTARAKVLAAALVVAALAAGVAWRCWRPTTVTETKKTETTTKEVEHVERAKVAAEVVAKVDVKRKATTKKVKETEYRPDGTVAKVKETETTVGSAETSKVGSRTVAAETSLVDAAREEIKKEELSKVTTFGSALLRLEGGVKWRVVGPDASWVPRILAGANVRAKGPLRVGVEAEWKGDSLKPDVVAVKLILEVP